MKEQNIAFKNNQGRFTYRVAAIIIRCNRLLMAKHEDYPLLLDERKYEYRFIL